jgi:hypothetical protein
LIEDLDLVADGQTPRHARSALDIASVVSSIAQDTAGSQTVVRASRGQGPSGLQMAIIAGLIVSLLINLGLLAMLASSTG